MNYIMHTSSLHTCIQAIVVQGHFVISEKGTGFILLITYWKFEGRTECVCGGLLPTHSKRDKYDQYSDVLPR